MILLTLDDDYKALPNPTMELFFIPGSLLLLFVLVSLA
jgi:hypothetical protein